MNLPDNLFRRHGAAATVRRLSRRCVFIIGPARCGTTALQNAMNASADIFLLGEPDLELDPGTAGFAARYRQKHARLGNLPNKSTALPPILPNDPPWWDWLSALAERHLRVGAKIALSPGVPHDRLLGLLGRLFYDSSYIFIFRDPLAAVVSLRRMGELPGRSQGAWDALFGNYLSGLRLYVRMASLFPHVHVLAHEQIGPASFRHLGAVLECDFARSAGYYDAAKMAPGRMEDIPVAHHAVAGYALAAYAKLRDMLDLGDPFYQKNQNTENVSPAHRTVFGSLAMLLDPELLARLGAAEGK